MRTSLATLLLLAFQPAVSKGIGFSDTWNSDGNHELTFTCMGNEQSYCQFMCGNGLACKKPQTHCRNCAGTNLKSFQKLFEDPAQAMEIGTQESGVIMAQYWRTEKFVTISADSILNFSRTYGFNDPDLGQRFDSLCVQKGLDGTKAYLFIDLDFYSQEPTQIRYLMCVGPGKMALFNVQDLRSEYSHSQTEDSDNTSYKAQLTSVIYDTIVLDSIFGKDDPGALEPEETQKCLKKHEDPILKGRLSLEDLPCFAAKNSGSFEYTSRYKYRKLRFILDALVSKNIFRSNMLFKKIEDTDESALNSTFGHLEYSLSNSRNQAKYRNIITSMSQNIQLLRDTKR